MLQDTVDLLQGRYNTALGVVMGDVPIQPYARRITNVVLTGPSGSTFKFYRGALPTPSMQMSSTPTGAGADNTYDTSSTGAPLAIGAGEQWIGVWSGGTVGAGKTGTATIRSVLEA